MTLIHTCELAGANAFDYLSQLQRHAAKLATNPAVWMPWNYQQQLAWILIQKLLRSFAERTLCNDAASDHTVFRKGSNGYSIWPSWG